MAETGSIQGATTDEFRFDDYCKALDDAMNELKKYLDQVLQMRLQCAELEIELATLYKPDLTQKLMECQKTCADCKGLIFKENDTDPKGNISSLVFPTLFSTSEAEKVPSNMMPLEKDHDTQQ